MSSVPANVYQSTLDPNSTPPRLFGGVEGLREYRSMPHGQTATVVIDNDDPWLFIYLSDDTTADDGTTSIKPTSVGTLEPGRWRRIAAVTGGAAAADWGFYAEHWSVEPTQIATITGGTVWEYTLDSVTRYRFVPDPYDPTGDAFYSTFTNPTLSGLLVTRG